MRQLTLELVAHPLSHHALQLLACALLRIELPPVFLEFVLSRGQMRFPPANLLRALGQTAAHGIALRLKRVLALRQSLFDFTGDTRPARLQKRDVIPEIVQRALILLREAVAGIELADLDFAFALRECSLPCAQAVPAIGLLRLALSEFGFPLRERGFARVETGRHRVSGAAFLIQLRLLNAQGRGGCVQLKTLALRQAHGTGRRVCSGRAIGRFRLLRFLRKLRRVPESVQQRRSLRLRTRAPLTVMSVTADAVIGRGRTAAIGLVFFCHVSKTV
ncbi:hypothetical protein AWB78_05820 [Caballeronia calidae]|uniref:Uncharacterized protein n=1 Tax=Caballeronia calidae TaxID=1777139 RepID=A0A158DYZ0_9BURK|nr:hypothetical protein AWB78_05820 [Caballeronia calidae]